jgi:hypothetical protein
MLLLAFKAMLTRGLTSEYINKGMITLIPKSGDHSKLGNWCPITLLGSIYKILAKTLARRIQKFRLPTEANYEKFMLALKRKMIT